MANAALVKKTLEASKPFTQAKHKLDDLFLNENYKLWSILVLSGIPK